MERGICQENRPDPLALLRIRGQKETFWLVTSLLYAKRYPAEEIRILYKKRWELEGLIKEIKIWLGADVLRSKTEEGIYKELCARIIAGNLIYWLMLKAAKKIERMWKESAFLQQLDSWRPTV